MENKTKLRILYLYHYLIQNSDSSHPISTVELIKMLKDKHGISVSRNTISNDLSMLLDSGLQFEVIHSTQNKYYFDGQIFEIPELKLLIDAVSSSKFITEHKSEELINKLLSLIPFQNANKLRRHIYSSDRIKSDNERGYYIVDAINEAIDSHKKISFYYTDYDVNKKKYVTNNGEVYTVSPFTLLWDGDYYYLRGYCDERNAMRTFRLDRIQYQPIILSDSAIPTPDDYSISQYSRSVFRMYDTDELLEVTLLCNVSTMKSIIDHFGMDIDTIAIDAEYFQTKVTVCASPTFFRWIFGFGGKIKIVSPNIVIEQYRKMISDALNNI